MGSQEFNNIEVADSLTEVRQAGRYDPVNSGMPKLDLSDKPVSYFEFWPAWFFYLPVALYCVLLSIKYRSVGLPMLANPNIKFGGMVGESKIDIMSSYRDQSSPFWLPFITGRKVHGNIADQVFDRWVEDLIKQAERASIHLPFVIKPDMGCRGAGVSLVQTRDQLHQYLMAFPARRRFIIQQLSPYRAEAGIFYVREPSQSCGTITSITLKYMPYVTGDGKSTLKSLIENDKRAVFLKHVYFEKHKQNLQRVPNVGEHVILAFAGSHAKGSIFRNGEQYITPQLTRAIDRLAKGLPAFYYGRFDIKFDSIEHLMRGENLSFIEVNGATSEATHIWDSRTTLRHTFATLFGQYRTLYKIGNQIRHQGHAVPSVWSMIKTWRREIKHYSHYPKPVSEL